MSGFNKVILIGNVGVDPEVVTFENGGKLAKLSLATSETYKNKDGEKMTDTQWHNVVVRGKTADIVEQYVKKGDKLLVEGKLTTRSYEDRDGNKRYVTEVVSFSVQMMGSPQLADNEERDGNVSERDGNEYQEKDDDLPF